uniref:Reverse transcriptase n=1 Tax=Quercus lobata TaxID=97700 RepID=A0A7N2KXZ8_QUELO
MGITATNNLGKYLGFPIIHQGRVGSAFNFVMEKVQSKLVGWKTNLLSRAGRLVLAKTAAAPIAEYYMQCHTLPIKVCDAIDKMVRAFLWGSTNEKKRMHMAKMLAAKYLAPSRISEVGRKLPCSRI